MLHIKIRPNIITADSKSELIRKITQAAGHKSSYMYPLKTKEGDNLVLYNLEKHNKKVVINKRKKKLVTEHGVSYQRDIVRQKHWKAFVYFIPRSLVKSYQQKNRNFEIEFK